MRRLAVFGMAAAFGLLAFAAGAETSLRGRIVQFSVLTYDDPAVPIFDGIGETVQVGDGVEFGLHSEGAQNGVDVAPVDVDIGPSRIEISFESGAGRLLGAAFNGYVLEFPGDCAVIKSAHIDAKATTLPLTDAALILAGTRLMINVQGLSYQQGSHIALDLVLDDCSLS
jgi:hypothetical protein